MYALAQFKSDKPVGADGERVWDPFLTRENPDDTPLTRDLVNPDRAGEWEIIWGREQNEFVFYHVDLDPTNIKVEVQDGKAVETELLDWEIAGYMPKVRIATKPVISGGFNFDWDGKGEEFVSCTEFGNDGLWGLWVYMGSVEAEFVMSLFWFLLRYIFVTGSSAAGGLGVFVSRHWIDMLEISRTR